MCLKLYISILKKIKISSKRKWKWKFEINRYTTYFIYSEKSLEKVVRYIKNNRLKVSVEKPGNSILCCLKGERKKSRSAGGTEKGKNICCNNHSFLLIKYGKVAVK